MIALLTEKGKYVRIKANLILERISERNDKSLSSSENLSVLIGDDSERIETWDVIEEINKA